MFRQFYPLAWLLGLRRRMAYREWCKEHMEYAQRKYVDQYPDNSCVNTPEVEAARRLRWSIELLDREFERAYRGWWQ